MRGQGGRGRGGRKAGNKANVDEKALVEDYMKGELSVQEITDKYRLKYIPYVYAVLKKWNIQTKRKLGKRSETAGKLSETTGKRESSTEISARDKSIVKDYAEDKLTIKQRRGPQQKSDGKEGDTFEEGEEKELQEPERMEDTDEMEDERGPQEDRQRCMQESRESEEDTQSKFAFPRFQIPKPFFNTKVCKEMRETEKTSNLKT